MGRFVLLVCILARVTTTSTAQTITQTFGSGANVFSMDFVTIGNPGNAADGVGGLGDVQYSYYIAKYEISRDIILKFNNLGAGYGYNVTMADMSSWGGNGLNKPATGVSWYEAAKFVNWLNQAAGKSAAYKFSGGSSFAKWDPTEAGYNLANPFRNSNALFVLPSANEWHKAAYFDGVSQTYFDYPTASNIQPTYAGGGTEPSTAVLAQTPSNGPSDVQNAGGLSSYGTMAQGGNVWEWNETTFDLLNDDAAGLRLTRGGAWNSYWANDANASIGSRYSPTTEAVNIGFRVTMVPEPSSLSLLALGSLVIAVGIRRRS